MNTTDVSHYVKSFYGAWGEPRKIDRVDDIDELYKKMPLTHKDTEHQHRVITTKMLIGNLFGKNALKEMTKDKFQFDAMVRKIGPKLDMAIKKHGNDVSKLRAALEKSILEMKSQKPVTPKPLADATDNSSWVMKNGMLLEVAGGGPAQSDDVMEGYVSHIVSRSSPHTDATMDSYISRL